ncbi:MAG: Gfo/Idh/MocA family oxidoreductase [Deltaproteobacteria bacterium]|nr:Gfo/Idh/MocA family oxidoreductase [Deltaproteobacteria bacterium]
MVKNSSNAANVALAPKVALIGAGYWGKNLVRNFAELGALSMVCDQQSDTLARARQVSPDLRTCANLSEVLADPEIEAVAIASPAITHYALAKEALLAGKDVFVEKPMALRVEEGQELVDLAEQTGRILMVGHILHYHPAIQKLKGLIAAGELGKIQYIYSNRLNIGKIRKEENILWSFAPHDISIILLLLGEMPTEVSVHGGNYLQSDVADVTMTTMSFGSGVKGHIYVSWLHPFKEQLLVVVGDRRMAVFDDTSPDRKLVLYSHKVEWVERYPMARKAEGEVVPIDKLEPLKAECAHFLECVQTRQKPRTDGAEGLRVLQVLQSCQQSLDHNGVPVKAVSAASPPSKQPYFVHSTAVIDQPGQIGKDTKVWHFSHILKDCQIGENCNIGQNVVIGPKVTIGRGCKIQNNISVYQGVTLEDDVFCGPSMVFTNVHNPRAFIRRMDEVRPTLVKTGASIGANATIVCGTTIGRYAFVGAGAVVTKDIPDHALVVGNPARPIGWMCTCGVKLNSELRCETCGQRFQKSGSGLLPL